MFINLKEFFTYGKIKDTLLDCLNLSFKNSNYVYRVSALQALSKLQNTIDKKDLNDVFKVC